MQTKKTFRFLSFILFLGLFCACENNEEELIDSGISDDAMIKNSTLQGKSTPEFGDFIHGSSTDPIVRRPNQDWYYTIRYQIHRATQEFIQPDGILYLKGATVGAVEVITADQGIPTGWIVIDQFRGNDEFGRPEERIRYQYLVIQYQG